MALVAATMKKDIEAALNSAFAVQFKDEIAANPKAPDSHKKLAAAISAVADVIVLHLTTMAQVAPGIPIVGTSPAGPVTGVTANAGLIV